MHSITNRILEERKRLGLSQEELAARAKLSLRTIQRIEKEETEPRGKTLQLIAAALELPLTDFEKGNRKKTWAELVIKSSFLVVLNLGMVCVYGFLTLPPQTTVHSKFGALLLGLFMPFFFSTLIKPSSTTQRMVQLGIGPLLYLLTFIALHGAIASITTWLFYCIVVHLLVLYIHPLFTRSAQ